MTRCMLWFGLCLCPLAAQADTWFVGVFDKNTREERVFRPEKSKAFAIPLPPGTSWSCVLSGEQMIDDVRKNERMLVCKFGGEGGAGAVAYEAVRRDTGVGGLSLADEKSEFAIVVYWK